jgi:hypothetical protein
MKAITPVYIDDIIGDIVQATADAIVLKGTTTTLLQTIQANEIAALGSTLIQGIRYSKSSYEELIENLAQADGSTEGRYNKYPLIHLVQDVSVKRGEDIGAYGTTSLNIVFIHQTEQTYKIEDRDAKVFKPVLWPMYYQFMASLFNSGWAWGDDTAEYKHTVTKKAFWGNRKLATASKNILNDYVDAIEVNNLQVKFNYRNC